VLPEFADLVLAEVRARHMVDLFHKLWTDRERNLAQRTIYNTVVSPLFGTRSSPICSSKRPASSTIVNAGRSSTRIRVAHRSGVRAR
jgi:hypothetical protein